MKLDKKNLYYKSVAGAFVKKLMVLLRVCVIVHFSNKHIYAQCIDDIQGHTLLLYHRLQGL